MKKAVLVVLITILFKAASALTYCTPVPSNGVNNYKLTYIGLAGLDTAYSTNATYRNVPDTVNNLTCYLRVGQTYVLNLTPGSQPNSTCAAWIDWNKDTTFAASEKLGEFVSSGPITISFQVPINSSYGKLRLRVRISNSTSINACTSYTSGQTIDFTITVLTPKYNDSYDFQSSLSCAGDFIDEVHLANMHNINSGSINGPVYNDYSYLSANIQCCTDYNLVVQTSSLSGGGLVYVLMDLNDNGSFDDIDEYIGDAFTTSGYQSDTIPIRVPSITGTRRMRIFFFNEVEDYLVNISASSVTTNTDPHIGHHLHDSGGSPIYSCVGPVTFYDLSCGVPTFRQWRIAGPVSDSSNAQNPTFNLPAGWYDVILTVMNSVDTTTETLQVSVENPILTTGTLGNDTTVCSDVPFELFSPYYDSGSGPDCTHFLWSTGDYGESILISASGTYAVHIESCDYSGCPTSDTINIIVSPTRFNVSGGGSFCQGGLGVSVGLASSQNGISYQLNRNGNPVGNALNGNGSALNFGNQTIGGTYTVTATNSSIGCTVLMNGNAIITANPSPVVYNVTGGGNYCTGGTGLPIGVSNSQTGVRYILLRNSVSTGTIIYGNGGPVNFPLQTAPGAYTITALDTASGCSNTMQGSKSIVVSQLPTIFNITGGGHFCSGGSGVQVGLNNSQTGVRYYLLLNNVATGSAIFGNSSSINFSAQTTAGTYTITALDTSTGCASTMSGSKSIVIDPLPATYNVTGGGNSCGGSGSFPIGLSNSQNGKKYTLLRNNVSTGLTMFGTGNAINFASQSTAGTYTITSLDTATGCASAMTGSATITAGAVPSVYNVTGGGHYCAGGNGLQIGLSSSQSGIRYSLLLNSVATGTIIYGNGSAINFSAQTVAGIYTVTGLDTVGGCSSVMSGSKTVVIDPAPVAFNVTGGGSNCGGGGNGFPIGLNTSQSGRRYTLLRNGVSTGLTMYGTGAVINFAAQSTAGTYTITALDTSTGCTATMQGSASVLSGALPNVYNVTGGGHYCAGGNGLVIGMTNSQTGIRYELLLSSVATGITVSGTGSQINFPAQTNAGVYTVSAVDTSSGCSSTMQGSATIAIDPGPVMYTVGGGGHYCQGGGGLDITLSNSQLNVTYQLYRNSIPAGSPLTGSGGSASFGPQTNPGNYTVVATLSGGCSLSFADTVSIVVDPIPYTFPLITGGHYCAGSGGAEVHIDSSAATDQYQLLMNGSPLSAWIPGTNSQISFGNFNTSGVYELSIQGITSSCSTSVSDTLNFIVDSLQQALIVTQPGIICIYSTAFTLTAVPAGGFFTIDGNPGSLFDPSIVGAGSHALYYEYTDSAAGCTSSAYDTVFVDNCLGIQSPSAITSITLFPNPANDHITVRINDGSGDLTLEIFDNLGRVVQRHSDIHCENNCEYTLSVENLVNGFYTIRLVTGKEHVYNSTFIKQ
jgi:hypothetical protein